MMWCGRLCVIEPTRVELIFKWLEAYILHSESAMYLLYGAVALD